LARTEELVQAIEQRTAHVLERDGRIRAFATSIGFRGYAVGEAPTDIAELVCRAPQTPGPGFFLPVRDAVLLRWALEQGLKAQWPAMLMALGTYQEPSGAFLPSIAF
jgi:hypothetical protein